MELHALGNRSSANRAKRVSDGGLPTGFMEQLRRYDIIGQSYLWLGESYWGAFQICTLPPDA